MRANSVRFLLNWMKMPMIYCISILSEWLHRRTKQSQIWKSPCLPLSFSYRRCQFKFYFESKTFTTPILFFHLKCVQCKHSTFCLSNVSFSIFYVDHFTLECILNVFAMTTIRLTYAVIITAIPDDCLSMLLEYKFALQFKLARWHFIFLLKYLFMRWLHIAYYTWGKSRTNITILHVFPQFLTIFVEFYEFLRISTNIFICFVHEYNTQKWINYLNFYCIIESNLKIIVLFSNLSTILVHFPLI